MTEHHLTVARTARFYSIGGEGGGTDGDAVRELWMVCHGYGQLAASFATPFEVLARPWRRIVAPEALSRFYLERSRVGVNTNASIGATWMTREDREHEIADQLTYLDALHELVRPPAIADRVKLRVLGFSQGVATVVRWVARSAVRPDELILWAGSFPPDVDVRTFADRLPGTSVVLAVGSRDELAPWAAADVTLGSLRDAGMTARLVTFNGCHRLDNAALASIAESFAQR